MSIWKVYGIRYTVQPSRPAHMTFMFGDPNEETGGLDYYSWVLVSDDRAIVVDTGAAEHKVKKLGRDWLAPPTEALKKLGVDPANMRRFEVPEDERAHYSAGTIDVEYRFGFQGSEWGELMGIANRTDFDLSSHSKASGKDLVCFDQATGERYTPFVIEPSFGLTRSLMAFLVDAYAEEEVPNSKGGTDTRTVLRLDPRLAPVKVAVLPLSRNEQLSPLAREIAGRLRSLWAIDFDDAGAIGRRYRRQDEVGTPFCVTIDFDSLEDGAVTVRERDSMAQIRVKVDELEAHLAQGLIGA